MQDDIRPVDLVDGKVRLIDQTLIPDQLRFVECADYREVADAIRAMVVRGAPAIGVAAALGIALGARGIEADDPAEFIRRLEQIAGEFRSTRPTAVNLFWAIDRMLDTAREHLDKPLDEMKVVLTAAATAILSDDIDVNRAIGRNGAELLDDDCTVLTHCNAGALATAGYGTALGVIRAAFESGKRIRVLADETRPRLQGMKLTAWELSRIGVPVTIITDGMAGWAMSSGAVDCVIVGADRIAANGDTANKIGTYGLAVLAKAHEIPFYVAAPISTVDFSIPDGSRIPIEERDEREVTHIGGVRLAPEGVRAWNPAFDVTPAGYVTAFITEKGVLRPAKLAVSGGL
ncbi:MAG: S-methyl-5-thioribose-1-phosphate isomerase [Armatimonadetes bacterium]|nr:S-methyl-5-thioribose-1-phosphate isomerase [Armatimonadota bacterium]